MKKVIIINIIICLSILLIFDIFYYFRSLKAENITIKDCPYINLPVNWETDVSLNLDKNNRKRVYNPIKNLNKPIILSGCSFAYSYGLNTQDSLANLLALNSNRIVYLIANCAGGINETLWTFKQQQLYKYMEEPEYILYVFIENHFSRMFSKIYSLQSPKLRPIYEISENYDSKQKICWFKYLFLSHIFKFYYREKVTLNYGIVDEDTLFKYIMATQKEIKSHWKNTKLIFIRYSEPNIEKPYLFSKDFIEKCQKNNIIYLDADDITFNNSGQRLIGDIYMQEDQHPSALAYKLFAPKLADKINNLKN